MACDTMFAASSPTLLLVRNVSSMAVVSPDLLLSRKSVGARVRGNLTKGSCDTRSKIGIENVAISQAGTPDYARNRQAGLETKHATRRSSLRVLGKVDFWSTSPKTHVCVKRGETRTDGRFSASKLSYIVLSTTRTRASSTEALRSRHNGMLRGGDVVRFSGPRTRTYSERQSQRAEPPIPAPR